MTISASLSGVSATMSGFALTLMLLRALASNSSQPFAARVMQISTRWASGIGLGDGAAAGGFGGVGLGGISAGSLWVPATMCKNAIARKSKNAPISATWFPRLLPPVFLSASSVGVGQIGKAQEGGGWAYSASSRQCSTRQTCFTSARSTVIS